MARPVLARLQSALLSAAAVCFLAGAATTVADVAARWLFAANLPAAIETTSFLIGFGALLSMPVCYERRSHVCAKLLSEMRPERFARPLGLLGAGASLIFAALLFWIVLTNALGKLGSPETTRDLGLPMTPLLLIVSGALAVALAFAAIGLRREISAGDS